jgi:broad-specificity NMP kinase
MKKYIIINGTMGAGKTTVGRRIAEKLGRAAFIDGDFVIELHPHIDEKETKPMQRDNILHMSKNYCNFDKCDTVILSWIMGEAGTEMIISEISKLNFQVYHFILTCKEESLTTRWHNDNINDCRTDENLKLAIQILNEFDKRTDCIFIDTSELSVDEVAERIIDIVGNVTQLC